MQCTKQDVQRAFERLVKIMGKQVDKGAHKGFYLDHIATYGGYVIVEYMENGGEDHPFGLLRRSAREMYLSLHMVCQALEISGASK